MCSVEFYGSFRNGSALFMVLFTIKGMRKGNPISLSEMYSNGL